jgi:hypothetical protein
MYVFEYDVVLSGRFEFLSSLSWQLTQHVNLRFGTSGEGIELVRRSLVRQYITAIRHYGSIF